MDSDLILDDGCLVGTRTNVYHLMSYFLIPSQTEDEIAKLYDLTPEQVAAARAYVLNHPDDVLAQHLRIEERIAIGNPPELVEQLRKAQEIFRRFRQWTKLQEELDANELAELEGDEEIPTDYLSFRKWVLESRPRVTAGS